MTDLRQCAILVGGLGTRLGEIVADTPKPLLPVGGRPFLAWLMQEQMRYGIDRFLLLTGHLSDRVRDAVQGLVADLPRPASIAISEEPIRAGTGGALHFARDQLDDHFLLCNGDSFLDCNLTPLLVPQHDAIGHLLLRPVPDTSRYGVVELSDGMVTAFRERPPEAREPAPGTINAGIYRFDRRILDEVSENCSLERDVLPRLAERGVLRGTAAEGYFIDIGIPADLARAQTELPKVLRRPALFLDRDGVLNVDHGWVGTRERFEWMPGAQQLVATATRLGWHVFIVTNQSGVARGHYDEAAVIALHGWMAEVLHEAGGTIDDVRFCPFHPEAAVERYRQVSDWRKPGPGMLLDLIRAWRLDPSRCLMIGDQPTDMAAAAAAGITGHLFPGGNVADFAVPLLKDSQ